MNLREKGAVYILRDPQHPDSWISAWKLTGNPGVRISSRAGNCDCWVFGMKPVGCHLYFTQTLLQKNDIHAVDVIYLPDEDNIFRDTYLRFFYQGTWFYLKVGLETKPPFSSLEIGKCLNVTVFESDWINKWLLKTVTLSIAAFLKEQGGVVPLSVNQLNLGNVTCSVYRESARYCTYRSPFQSHSSFGTKYDGVLTSTSTEAGSATTSGNSSPNKLTKEFSSTREENRKSYKRQKSCRKQSLVNKRGRQKPLCLRRLGEEQKHKDKMLEYPSDFENYYYSLFVARSQVPGCKGLGVFAREKIDKDTHIGVIKKPLKQRAKRKRIDTAANIHTIYIDDNSGRLFARRPGKGCAFRYLNKAMNTIDPMKSPEANVTFFSPSIIKKMEEWTGDTYVRALRAIDEGEELLFSYDTDQVPALNTPPTSPKGKGKEGL